jgi:dihydroneopterin aldolase
MTTDFIFIKGLKIKTAIGIAEWERRILQTIVIDINLYLDLQKIATEDNVARTVNYKTVADRIKELVKTQGPFNLVEALAEKIATLIKAEFPIDKLHLTISKPSVFSDIAHVGVCIER